MVRFAEPAGLYTGFRMDALSALFYFSNWWQIATSSNYFVATGAVSPLTHTWSLAVEEQFYLIWPLVVLVVMGLSRSFGRGVKNLLVLSVVGAIASTFEMALLYSPSANLTRLYFGTDSHAQSILVGAALACAMTIIQLRREAEGMAPRARSRIARRGLVLLGMAGVAGTLTLTYLQNGTSSFDYQGGFMLSALSAAAIIIAAACVPHGPVANLLSLRPLVWLGTISYGAYLWHYPVSIYLDAADWPRRTRGHKHPLRIHDSVGHPQLLSGRTPGHDQNVLAVVEIRHSRPCPRCGNRRRRSRWHCLEHIGRSVSCCNP